MRLAIPGPKGVARYRVFGCPAICKVYIRKSPDGQVLDRRNIVQRGVRGIFIGFPLNQAGWSIYIPSSRNILTSADVSFDEDFSSVAALPDKLYHDSLDVRDPSPRILDPNTMAFTGPPLYVNEDVDPNAPWTPYTAIPPEEDPDVIYEDEIALQDVYIQEDQTKEGSNTLLSSKNDIDPSSVRMLEHYLKMLDTQTGDVRYFDVEDTTSSKENDRPRRSARRQQLRSQTYKSYVHHIMQTILKKGGLTDRTTTEYLNAMQEGLGDPGTDPGPFLPEPRDVWQIIRGPTHVRQAWSKPFYKEVKGLVHLRQVFKMEDPKPGEPVVPIMMVFKCKIDMFGMIDKLKCRAVFRGDLHTPTDDMDPWNPHASWVGLRVFLATCARRRMYPCQIDYVMAYVQASMKGRVFAIMPEHWKELLPIELHKWIGRPLLLLKALYGYTFSGKLLYEEQAEFLEKYGMRHTAIIALWKKSLPNGKILLVLQYSDDFLAACDDSQGLEDFKTAIGKRFDIEIKPRADWYLQARIRQDADGNIVLDQQRYSKSIVQRYLPNSPETPTPEDMARYRSPLPHTFKWTKEDNSKDKDEVKSLENEYGFRYIDAVGSLNYLANTATEELFAIRKACKHMNLPGRKHFQGVIHLLHHLRCYPTQGIMFYHDWKHSPIYNMLIAQDIKVTDGTLIWFTDASHGDCDEARSTCCYLGFYQGGIIDMSSFVAQPIPHSTAESETIAISVGAMACAYARMGIADILFDNADKPWTIPLISDSSAAIAMNSNNKPTKRNKHIDRRYFYGREEFLASKLEFHHIDADHSLADLGTKNLTAEESAYKLSIVEYPVTDHVIGTKTTQEQTMPIESKKGDENIVDDELLTAQTKLTTHTTDSTHTRAKLMDRMMNNVCVPAHEYTHEGATQTRRNEIEDSTTTGHTTEEELMYPHGSKEIYKTKKGRDDRRIDQSLCSEK
jgi:hypothetical protein